MCGLILIDRRHVKHGNPTVEIRDAINKVNRRGPHTFGWALFGANPGADMIRGAGMLPEPPNDPWSIALGHARLATSGAHPGALPDPADGQPVESPTGIIIAHNGVLPHRGHPTIPDTHLAARHIHDPADIRSEFVTADRRPQAVIAVTPERCVATFRTGRKGGHPIYLTETPHARIFASLPLTPQSTLVPEGLTCW